MSAPAGLRAMTALEWALLVVLSVLWGGSFFFNGVAVRELSTLTIVFFRVATALVLLLAVLRIAGIALPLCRSALVAYLGMGIANNAVPLLLIVWAQHTIPSGLASILNATTPLFTVLVMHAFSTDEKATPAKLAGVALGLAGVGAMVGADAVAGGAGGVLAQLAMLGAAMCYALAGWWGRRFARLGIPPLAAATGQLAVSAFVLLPFAMGIDRPWAMPMPGLAPVLAVLGLAVFSTALAYAIFFRIMARAGATNIALVTFLIPVSAILMGVLFLGDTLALRHVAGMATIGLGLALIDGRLFRRRGGAA